MQILTNLTQKKNEGSPILGVMTGSGLVANTSLDSGADLVFALNAGLYRNLGIGTLASYLPYGNSNTQTLNLISDQFQNLSQNSPIIAGVFAHDPNIDLEKHFEQLKKLGVKGVVNWPSVGLLDGSYRMKLEEEGVTTEVEMKMLVKAKKHGFDTFGMIWKEENAMKFSQANIDCLIINLGLTKEVDDYLELHDQLQLNIQNLKGILKHISKSENNPIKLVFGGVTNQAEDLEQIYKTCKVDGFAGGSVFDRIPVQNAVKSTVRQFKSVFAGNLNSDDTNMGTIIGKSEKMKELFTILHRVSKADVNVYIEGESGTGKELVASQLHELSDRESHPFVTLNCGAIPDTLFESELFGHEKGAFTGASRRRLGKFELAHNGVLFLDEIADLSPHGQVALLRAIQQREITRVGGEKAIPINVRIVSASNRGLLELVDQGAFRADLYYRLNGVTIKIPPLRERKDDISLLLLNISKKLEHKLNKSITGFSPRFIEKMNLHSWPGNVRELEHVIGQAAILEEGRELQGTYFVPDSHPNPITAHQNGFSGTFEKNRKEIAEDTLKKVNGNKSKAAKMLNITRKTLYSWLEQE